MKRTAFFIAQIVFFHVLYAQEKTDSFYTLSPVEVRATRVSEKAPFTKTNFSKKEIAKLNLGQDIPFLLNQSPSVVVNSDAGNGVGYTGIRIRGTDATRINMTINGIPYNDAESQGLFFVNLPDFSSSVNSIQLQRGVGTSSNGAGAFGATINFSTNEINKEAFAEINNSYGSFNTWKNTVKAGTGLLHKHFTVDARLSRISSDGFIDRASSNLQSFYFSTAYIGEKNSLRFNVISGKEKTYQAWYGISEADLKAGNRRTNSAGTEKPGNPYTNEVDNYTQTHYQLFYNQTIQPSLQLNIAAFLTKGNGYYEQYKADEKYSKYNLPNAGNTDLIRRLGLDNDFYGGTFSLQHKNSNSQTTLGGAYTTYNGNHIGTVLWAGNGMAEPVHEWYKHPADKKDLSIYLKEDFSINNSWSLFADMQYRYVKYTINGFRDHPTLSVSNSFNFMNPKLGISYHQNQWKAYLSYGLANKEPNREDFEAAALAQPKAEQLHDVELGIEKKLNRSSISATLYYMYYNDQLVLTGKINDVGAYTRTNIDKSYRMGIEIEATHGFTAKFNVAGNIAFSNNKVLDFKEYLDDYDAVEQKVNRYSTSDIALSPRIVSSFAINFLPIKNMELSCIGKSASKQFLDNTQNDSRKLNGFFVTDLRASYTIKTKAIKALNLIAQVNNIFNRKYEPNGYTYSYIYEAKTVTENFYFPMAGTNLMFGINFSM